MDHPIRTVAVVGGGLGWTERRAALPADKLRERAAWRDRRLMALVTHRRKQPMQ